MARITLIVAVICLSGLFDLALAAEPRSLPSFFYPLEHRSDLKALQERAAMNGYDLQVVPNDEFPVVEYDSPALSLLSFVWDYVPSPITAVKAVVSKVWTIVKFLLPVDLVLLGMALVVGFCAFTPYCTLIIEEPIASKLRAIGANIPYLDEMENYFNEAVDNVNSWQTYEFI